MAAAIQKFKLVFNVPVSSLEACKTAIFAAGTGQFRPGDKANPHIGTVGNLEHVDSAKVETLCVGEDVVRKAVEGLKAAHPYEEPSYDVYKLEDF
ncbi:hypothetical protein DV736_g174, partial [Chaetothyriales sp. CBS 134916]